MFFLTSKDNYAAQIKISYPFIHYPQIFPDNIGLLIKIMVLLLLVKISLLLKGNGTMNNLRSSIKKASQKTVMPLYYTDFEGNNFYTSIKFLP
ncbi:hypothetical protein CLU97_1575 [Chryseobacterium sp. 7]|nr:hypothetical protein CLU97_1575 [Chryseobacterium sp. 7]